MVNFLGRKTLELLVDCGTKTKERHEPIPETQIDFTSKTWKIPKFFIGVKHIFN